MIVFWKLVNKSLWRFLLKSCCDLLPVVMNCSLSMSGKIFEKFLWTYLSRIRLINYVLIKWWLVCLSGFYSCLDLATILSRMHCFTPRGVLGSLNSDQHSSRIFCLTAFGTDRELKTSLTKGSKRSTVSPSPFEFSLACVRARGSSRRMLDLEVGSAVDFEELSLIESTLV